MGENEREREREKPNESSGSTETNSYSVKKKVHIVKRNLPRGAMRTLFYPFGQLGML